MTRTSPIIPSRAGKGRGRRAGIPAVEKRNEKILAAAAELFLQDGFDGTSMDAIAARARTSKRTLYSRYADKSTLFNAVIYHLLSRLLVASEDFHYDEPAELEPVLLGLAHHMIGTTSKPEFLAVHRVIPFETQRRPQFAGWLDHALRKPVIHVVAALLQRYREELRLNDFEGAAEQFSNLVFDSCLRFGMLGMNLSPREIGERTRAAVELFLSGARRRDLHGPFMAAREKSSDLAP